MRRRLLALVAVLAAVALGTAGGAAPIGATPTSPTVAPATPGQSTHFQLVGKNALYHRGMNAAPAIYGHYLYVGNRTDSSDVCADGTTGCRHPHPGILILDVANPASPEIVGEIGKPYAAKVGVTTRELRVWPQKRLLIVMNFRCSSVIHACPPGNDLVFPYDYTFFDLTDPVHPRFIERYVPVAASGRAVKPHEMYLWIDPNDADRALMWFSTPTISTSRALPNLMVADISEVPSGGPVQEVAEGNWNDLYPGTDQPNYPFDSSSPTGCGPYNCNLFVHSMATSVDGRTTYLAMEAGQFLMLDTSSVVAAASPPASVIDLHGDLLTDPADRPVWLQSPADPATAPDPCTRNCPNGHTSLEVPGTHYALTTDEVYGTYTNPAHGCGWGWARLLDVADPAHPTIVGQYEIAENQPSFCGSPGDDPATDQFASYSSHNPTVLPDLAFIAWHSGGLQALDLSDPANPSQAGVFIPRPIANVAIEDPALSRGGNRVVFWSYPIIRNGLVYVIDVRNGLYVLRYTGPHAAEVSGIGFYEGNSNLGDAAALEG